jgi:hypothetical protein
MFTYFWMDTQIYPYPDFDIDRRCVNHDALLDWQKTVEIDQDLVDNAEIPRPKDARVQPDLPQLAKLDGWTPNGRFPD